MDNDVTQRMFVKCTIGGIETYALVDIGATHSVISSDFMEALRKKRVKLNIKDASVIVADGAEVQVTGTAVIPINLESNTWVGNCLVLKNAANPVILGISTIRGLKMIVNCANDTICQITKHGLEKIQVYYCDSLRSTSRVNGILVRKHQLCNQRFALSSLANQPFKVEDMKLYRDISKEEQSLEIKFKLSQ